MAETGLIQNWNRDYDPQTGKYIESDPIGLKGGINTYGYAHSKPLLRTDSTGLLVQGTGWIDAGPGYWARVQAAEAKIRSVLSKSCPCPSSGSSGNCIPCDRVPAVTFALDTSVVHYQPVLPLNPGQVPGTINCGKAPNVTPYIRLGDAAFSYPPCGCLASTIYHELLHNIGGDIGMDEAKTAAAEGKCTGDLCGGGQSGVVDAIIIN